MYDDLKPYIDTLRQLAAQFMAMQLELEEHDHLKIMTAEQLEAITVVCNTIENEVPDMYDMIETKYGELREMFDYLNAELSRKADQTRLFDLESHVCNNIESRLYEVERRVASAEVGANQI